MKQKITNRKSLGLPCNNRGTITSEMNDDEKEKAELTEERYVWNYSPIHKGFLCSGCGKELIKIEELRGEQE